MPLINEDSLEQIWLKYLQEIGYSTIYGPDTLPDGPNPLRADVRQPYLPQNLKAALERINPTATPQMLEDAYAQLTRFQEASLILKNQKFCQVLAEGVKVNHKDATGRDTATYLHVLDYTNPDNNEFLAINQFTIQGHTNTRRADIIIFINGLPMVVIELKNPSKETTDIPKLNILFLKEGKIDEGLNETFGANISDLLRDVFFLEKGFSGKFARTRINKIIEEITIFIKDRGKTMSLQKYEDYTAFIELIGEPIIKNKLLSIVDDVYFRHEKDKILFFKEKRLKKELAAIGTERDKYKKCGNSN